MNKAQTALRTSAVTNVEEAGSFAFALNTSGTGCGIDRSAGTLLTATSPEIIRQTRTRGDLNLLYQYSFRYASVMRVFRIVFNSYFHTVVFHLDPHTCGKLVHKPVPS